jgi:hypothetical protein
LSPDFPRSAAERRDITLNSRNMHTVDTDDAQWWLTVAVVCSAYNHCVAAELSQETTRRGGLPDPALAYSSNRTEEP